MLTQIHIHNLVTIHELNLDCQTGTTVITGETGAGKSILIDAIELALGKRATVDIIRAEQEKLDVSICFDISQIPEARAWLKSFDLDNESNECIIRRTLSRDGRSRSYINGMPTTLQPLRELSEFLINIHGQHEHQSLLKQETQRSLLDLYAGHQDLVDQVHVLADEWNTLERNILSLRSLTDERKSRSDFLKFQLNELEALNLTPDEFQALDLEHKQLAHAGELLQNINHALGCLVENEENNALSALNHAVQALESVQHVDPKMSSWIESLKSAVISISDTEDDLHRYLDSVDLNPERLQWLEERIGTLFDIARKHKIAPQDLYEFQQKIAKEFSELENSDEHLAELIQKQNAAAKKYQEVANKLSDSRKKSAKKLQTEISKMIRELAMPHGEFHISLETETTNHFSPHGLEKIYFQIKTNAGHTPQLLTKIASGGELSRISLAIHMATAEQHTVPILIFDEVDVGVGGGTAEVVGKLLRRLGETHQIFCITHAPQVASQGHHHLRVEKHFAKNSTQTKVNILKPEEKIAEIARMLGGLEMTHKTLEHAKEMVEKAIS
jgi:DNA repair protein RecN (Recombination protein N)